MLEQFIAPVVGGLIIGVAASAMLVLKGRVAGISGVLGGVLRGDKEPWRFAFLIGLLAGGFVLSLLAPAVFAAPAGVSLTFVVVAGLLVGVGTQMGGGCTSGHGVCGIGRLSPRSIVATLTFMAAGAVVASIVSTLGGAQ